MPAEFRYRRSVRFAETDMAGVMHFSNYYRWMEDCEHAFWRSLGLSVYVAGDDGHFSWPRVETRCTYRRPARFEQELELFLSVVRLGGRSLTLAIRFECAGEEIARGEMSTVCCRIESGRFTAIEIPSDIRAVLAPYEAAKEQE